MLETLLQRWQLMTPRERRIVVAGAALFIRYSFAAFLRMWLLRNLYEGQANTDRIVEAIADSKA